MIVYDVSNRNSFNSVQKWIDDVKNQRGEGVIIALLGNKIDLEERDVPSDEAMKLAADNQIIYKEVSAKSGINVQEFFKEIAGLLPDDSETQNIPNQVKEKADVSKYSAR